MANDPRIFSRPIFKQFFFFPLFEFRMYAVNERKLMRISAWRHILFPRFFFLSLSQRESSGVWRKGGGGSWCVVVGGGKCGVKRADAVVRFMAAVVVVHRRRPSAVRSHLRGSPPIRPLAV